MRPAESTQVNEARDAFDEHDDAEGLLAFENVGKVLDKLGFDEVGFLAPFSRRSATEAVQTSNDLLSDVFK